MARGNGKVKGTKEAKTAPRGASSAKVKRPDVKVFIEEYKVHRNGRRAAIAAGYSANSADSTASRLLRSAKVRAEIEQARAEFIEKVQVETGITAQRALQEAWNIVVADPRELVEHYVGCCRHCWGEGFRYQRTTAEFNQAYEAHVEKKLKGDFDQMGGIGFDATKGPNEECPECAGGGRGRTIIKDTRFLSPQALALYGGIKQTKEGIDVRMHSKLDALEKVFKHLGLYERDNEQKKPELAEHLAAFVGQLHQSGAGRLPIAPQRARAKR